MPFDKSIPLVTVGMPVYNGAALLAETVESILRQTYRDFIFLVLDDGSTDTSVQVVESFVDPRIRIVRNPANLGLVRSLNRIFDLVETPFLVRTDADDLSAPDRIERLVAFMQSRPDVDICGSHVAGFGAWGRSTWRCETENAWILARLPFGCPMHHGAAIFRMAAIRRTGIRYRESCPQAQDWDFWNQCRGRLKLANIAQELYHYRDNMAGVSRTRTAQQTAIARRIITEILADMGVIATEADLDLHWSAIVKRIPEAAPPTVVLEWLDRLKQANQASRLFDTDAFNAIANDYIFDLLRDHKADFAKYSIRRLGEPRYARFLATKGLQFFRNRLLTS